MLIAILTAIHILGVVIWIGGVAFVTMTVFPMILRMESSLEKMLFFQGIEHRFAKIAKICVLLVGMTGFLLLYLTEEWKIMFTIKGLSPTFMFLVWIFYVLILLFEARLFKVIFKGDAQKDTSKIFYRLTIFHWVILVLSFSAIFIGVLSAHGGL
jgi:uncharacterized membrane protein